MLDDMKIEHPKDKRRQYRSCDRCRVGKRACNAVYDSVAEAINNKVACSNCRKKGRLCSFQYVLSILGGLPTAVASTSSTSSDGLRNTFDATLLGSTAVPAHDNVARTFSPLLDNQDVLSVSAVAPLHQHGEPNHSHYRESFQIRNSEPIVSVSVGSLQGGDAQLQHRSQGRKQQGSTAMVAMAYAASRSVASLISPRSSTSQLSSNLDRIFLNDRLIRIYEGAAEQALRCWVTSSNTPYMLDRSMQAGMQPFTASNTHRLAYWRICELDRGSRSLLGRRNDGGRQEREIMDAFHSVILAFAAQWAPQWINSLAAARSDPGAPETTSTWMPKAKGDKIRLALWERAKEKLQKVASLDSFRVIFALIIFAWTEKPREIQERAEDSSEVDLNAENCALDTSTWQSPAEGTTFLLVAALRKMVSIRYKVEGKKRRGLCPWNSPHVKTLKQQMPRESIDESSCHDEPNAELAGEAGRIQRDLEKKHVTDRDTSSSQYELCHGGSSVPHANDVKRMEGTYHMMLWFSVLLDTETAVLRKHPPVVCDEDSEVMSSIPGAEDEGAAGANGQGGRRGIWDDYILDISKRKQNTEFSASWPCDEAKAAATLAFSTPVKVVMFRQISRLQMSFWRRASTRAVEQHIRSGLAIVHHWNQLYGPLLDTCRASHAELPASLQSWYVLLAFPWYLAVLLFVEMVQTVDMAGCSDEHARAERARSGIFPKLRDRACADTAALITAIQATEFDHGETTFDFVKDTGGTVLHTEPWTEILCHSLTAVAKTEIKLHDGYCALFMWRELEESQQRISKCLWALEQVSDRSPSACLAHEQILHLTQSRKQRQYPFEQIPLASPPLNGVSNAGHVLLSSTDSTEATAHCGSSPQVKTSVAETDVVSVHPPNDLLEANRLVQRDDIPPDYMQLFIECAAPTTVSPSIQSQHAGPASQTELLDAFATIIGTAMHERDVGSIEPSAILEQLSQLASKPVQDVFSSHSDSSSVSLETHFSQSGWIDSLVVNDGSNNPNVKGSHATSTTSIFDSDSDTSTASPTHRQKRSKQNYRTENSSLGNSKSYHHALMSLDDRVWHGTTSQMASASLNTDVGVVSVPLQDHLPRQPDELYGDDDDDDLVQYRQNLKRKRADLEVNQ